MLGSFLPRVLLMVFGYAYPAYECYKTVEKNKPEIEQLLFWCQYWILVAMLTVLENLGMLYFHGYQYTMKPNWHCLYISGLLRRKARPIFIIASSETLWPNMRQKLIALNYGQKGVYEILEYVSSHQSAPQPHSDQKQEKGTEKVIAGDQSEAVARDQRTTSDFEEKPTESVSLSENVFGCGLQIQAKSNGFQDHTSGK
ncbi:putative HVA22-like protein g [Prunus yedoensis var. nudiflora]|uniref:Putative HVA22-like protein g n=1 Tax=Prunus yedoensis var. nudiflora TaxID=2094558 RepID=A0A314UM97_PRUYE|nr:putative HVA22-like protein g [Prunus yedoensis var. nudiflora]